MLALNGVDWRQSMKQAPMADDLVERSDSLTGVEAAE